MAVVKQIALGLAAAVVAGVLDGGVARVLMRGVALATREPTAFSLEATLGIMLIFAITAVPLAVTAELTSRRQARLTAGVVGTVVLGFFAVSIGLQEVASAEGLGVLRWTALVACLAGLAIFVLLQPWVVLGMIRRGRIRGAAPEQAPRGPRSAERASRRPDVTAGSGRSATAEGVPGPAMLHGTSAPAVRTRAGLAGPNLDLS